MAPKPNPEHNDAHALNWHTTMMCTGARVTIDVRNRPPRAIIKTARVFYPISRQNKAPNSREVTLP